MDASSCGALVPLACLDVLVSGRGRGVRIDGGRWPPGGVDASGPSVPLTRLPLGQYLNANGWDTGWGGWAARVALIFNWRYRFFLDFGNRIKNHVYGALNCK